MQMISLNDINTKVNYIVRNVRNFGAVGNGTTNDTTAFTNAITGAKAVYVPAGTYLVDGGFSLPNGFLLYGDGPSLSILLMSPGVTSNMLQVFDKTRVVGLSINGNASGQTSSRYAIVGWQCTGAVIEDVAISNNFGIGVGWSVSQDCQCIRVTVDGCTGSLPGFWNGGGGLGRHRYIDCCAVNNQLDGLMICTASNVVTGGTYSSNGYGGSYHSALGAAGIFTPDSVVLNGGLNITGVTCDNNTEMGINVSASPFTIANCMCRGNQLAGIFVKGGSNGVINGNLCANNGWYTGTLNPTVWRRGGIVCFPACDNLAITNNMCYDDSNNVQEYGIAFGSTNVYHVGSNLDRLTMFGNECRGNKIDNDNIMPLKYSYSNLTNLQYCMAYDTDGRFSTNSLVVNKVDTSTYKLGPAGFALSAGRSLVPSSNWTTLWAGAASSRAVVLSTDGSIGITNDGVYSITVFGKFSSPASTATNNIELATRTATMYGTGVTLAMGESSSMNVTTSVTACLYAGDVIDVFFGTAQTPQSLQSGTITLVKLFNVQRP